uniref:Uncharacterized protein n=1 Tax=Anguilla anguilla TaxID=7936 RepID=A0A0E9VRC6_ANGAN
MNLLLPQYERTGMKGANTKSKPPPLPAENK